MSLMFIPPTVPPKVALVWEQIGVEPKPPQECEITGCRRPKFVKMMSKRRRTKNPFERAFVPFCEPCNKHWDRHKSWEGRPSWLAKTMPAEPLTPEQIKLRREALRVLDRRGWITATLESLSEVWSHMTPPEAEYVASLETEFERAGDLTNRQIAALEALLDRINGDLK